MKRIFVFVPTILLVLFLINSFVLKEKEAREKTNIVFKSTDGGQTWQDISKGLPENLRRDTSWRHFQIIRQGKNMEIITSFCRR